MAERDTTGERLARIEGIVGRIEKEIDRFFNHFSGDTKDLREEIRDLREEIRDNRRLMLFILIPMWVTIILSIVGLFLKIE